MTMTHPTRISLVHRSLSALCALIAALGTSACTTADGPSQNAGLPEPESAVHTYSLKRGYAAFIAIESNFANGDLARKRTQLKR